MIGNGRPWVQLSLGGIKVTTLCDTGASVSLLRQSTFESYCRTTHRPTFLQPASSLVGVSGAQLHVLGLTEVSVNCLPITVTIVRHLPHDMILGAPQLRKGGAKIDFPTNTLTWHDRSWPFHVAPNDPHVHITQPRPVIRPLPPTKNPQNAPPHQYPTINNPTAPLHSYAAVAARNITKRQYPNINLPQNPKPPPLTHQKPGAVTHTRFPTKFQTASDSVSCPFATGPASGSCQQNRVAIATVSATPSFEQKHSAIFPPQGQPGQIAGLGTELPTMGCPTYEHLLRHYAHVFSAKGETNGTCDLAALTITTTGPPISQKAYRTPLHKRRIIEDAIDEMLNDGIIRPSSSPWASPVTLVPKRDSTTRFCVDYRRLNAITVKDTYPLPLIEDIFDQVAGSMVYSTLDLKAGYHQLPVAEPDIEKTAFRCHRGLFEFVKMPFGVCNGPSVFQRTMDRVLAGLVGVCVFVYLDDIVVYSDSHENHTNHLRAVFERIAKAGLRLKPTKCHFGLPEVKLLGYIISRYGKRADPDKVSAIADLKPPTTIKEVRSFLGMASYYRACVPDYARIAEPLTALTRKNARLHWSDDRQQAFDSLKSLLISNHVMAPPRTDRPYKLYTDACDYAVGAILVQDDDDGIERVIQYVSHSLSAPQRRWSVIEREAYAVVYAIQKLRTYLYGAKFTVYTDHRPLRGLFTKALNSTKVQRWGVLLAEYGAKIEYRQGKHNIRADMLSRIKPVEEVAILDVGEWVDPAAIPEHDIHELLPLVHDGLDLNVISQEQRVEFPDLWLKGQDPEEDDYVVIRNTLYSTRHPQPTAAGYPRLVLPAAHREAVIDRAHREVGHMAAWKTTQRITEAYVWPRMRKAVTDQLVRCPVCIAHNRHNGYAPPGEMPLAVYPMQIVSMDLIGPLVETPQGHKYALTLIDHCTGWAEAYPLADKTNRCVWNAFSTQFISRHGVPEVLITDNGGEFIANAFTDYLVQLGIEHHRTTPAHPASNGRVERFNRTIKELLQRFCDNASHDWENKMGDALLAYRTSVSSVTGYTPFFLLYGRRSRMPLTRTLRVDNDNAFGNRLDDLARALRDAKTSTYDSRRYNRERLQRRANLGDLQVGDSVVLKAEQRGQLTSRWDPHWEVTRVSGPVVHIRNQLTGAYRPVNREKVRLVDPTLAWDEVNPRPPRVIHRARRFVPPPLAPHIPPAQAIPPPQPIQPPHAPPRPPRPPPPPIPPRPPQYQPLPADTDDDTEQETTTEDEDYIPPQPLPIAAQPSTPQPLPIAAQPSTSHSQHTRPQRASRLSRRAQEAADAQDSDSDMPIDPIISHYRKRNNQTPATDILPGPTSQKIARCEAIALVRRFCGSSSWDGQRCNIVTPLMSLRTCPPKSRTDYWLHQGPVPQLMSLHGLC